jgi:DNA-binding HxlR family transcriptional regulator
MTEIKSNRFDDMVAQVKKYGGCPVSSALKLFGGKWKPLILYFISVDVNRFGQLQRMMPGCSKRMMTKQLRELESDGLIDRKVFAVVPPKVIYTLTKKGESLRPVFRELSKWGISHVLEPRMSQDGQDADGAGGQ